MSSFFRTMKALERRSRFKNALRFFHAVPVGPPAAAKSARLSGSSKTSAAACVTLSVIDTRESRGEYKSD